MKKENENKNVISIRFPEPMLNMIKAYASLSGINHSDAVRQFVRIGAQNKVSIEFQERFMKDQENRWLNLNRMKLIEEGKNLIMERDNHKCRKCGSKNNLTIYHIDKNPINKDPRLQITLCKNCNEQAEKYSPQRRVFEDFVEWLCLL